MKRLTLGTAGVATGAVEGSLRRRRPDYIDLPGLHGPDVMTLVDKTLRTQQSPVTAVKVRYVCRSNFLAYQLTQAIGRSTPPGVVQLQTTQPYYNLLFRQFERELLPLCRDETVAVLPYNVALEFRHWDAVE